jgi:methanogenic corrinoid protein MtbC1
MGKSFRGPIVQNESPLDSSATMSCEDWSSNYEAQSRSLAWNKAFSKKQLLLERIVSNNIVPHLVLANLPPSDVAVSTSESTAVISNAVIGEFAELVIERDVDASIAYFENLRSQGAKVEALFQDLLAPVACRLGELWDEDINDFLDVTRGVSHLQQIVHTFSDDLIAEGRCPASNRRALLMPMPGEQHTFGVSLIGEHFRREGWRVWGGPPRTLDDILELVTSQWFDVIGLSMSAVADPVAVAASVSAIRKRSLNENVKVLVGGGVFASQPELTSIVGADATAMNGHDALVQITDLIGQAPKSV